MHNKSRNAIINSCKCFHEFLLVCGSGLPNNRRRGILLSWHKGKWVQKGVESPENKSVWRPKLLTTCTPDGSHLSAIYCMMLCQKYSHINSPTKNKQAESRLPVWRYGERGSTNTDEYSTVNADLQESGRLAYEQCQCKCRTYSNAAKARFCDPTAKSKTVSYFYALHPTWPQ